MASLVENLRIIRTAVYGKEIRPAVYDALMQSWNEIMAMETSVEELNKRVDSLPNGGSGGDQGGSDEGGVVVVDELTPPILVVYGAVTANEKPISITAV